MAETFDPYHVWLGIPPKEQPANRYRLLSVPLFESNPDVIDNAADQRTAHLRTFQSSKNAQLAERLLNEVAAARICLLDAKKRAAYDQTLRAALAAQAPAPVAKGSTQPQPQPQPGAASLPMATALPGDGCSELLGDAARKPHKNSGQSATLATPAKPATSAKPGAPRPEAKRRPIPLFVAAGVLLAAAIGVGVHALTASPADGALTFDWPADARTGAELSVDGVPVSIPASGPWEYRCSPGKHLVVAIRPAFELETVATVAPGEQQSIAADWQPKATLVLNWPTAERKDATLLIDGVARQTPSSEPIEFPIEPGRHAVRVARMNSEPFEIAMVVADGEHRAVAVSLRPWPTLVLDWSVEQRKDAVISIDNEPLSIDSSEARPELRLSPGRHEVRIVRPGYQPFEQTATLAAGGTATIRPVLAAVATVAPIPAVAVSNQAASHQPPSLDESPPHDIHEQPVASKKRLSIPSSADQERIAKLLSDIYKVAHSPAKDKALAAQLFKTADDSGNSPAERYMLLMKAVSVAAGVGDYDAAFQGIDSLASTFEIDASEAKQNLLKESIKGLTATDQVASFVAVAEQFIDQTVAADQFDAALAVIATAKEAIAKRPSDARLLREEDEHLTRRRHEIAALQKSSIAADAARETLKEKPNDADANAALGRWLCLLKNDWSAGLPLLAKGGDPALKTLAVQELAGNLDEKQQTELADGWWDVAQKETDLEQEGAREHAAALYRAALPKWQSPLKQAEIQKRLIELATIPSHGGSISPSASGGPFAHNQWIDLIRLVGPTTDAIYGSWSRKGADLVSEPADFARISFPIEINGSYDLEVEFTRKEGNDEINAIIPVGAHPCMVMLSAFDGKASGLSRAGGVSIGDQKEYAVHPGKIENDRRYRLLISVRLIKGKMASVEAFLQGKPIWPLWKGPASDLATFAGWGLPTAKRIGLGAWNDKVLFHSVRLKVISGDATMPFTAAEVPPTIRVLSARFGGGNNWADVTERVREAVRNGGAVWATTDFLKKDPTPGWKKQLVIKIDKSGERKDLWFGEGSNWRLESALAK